MSVIILSDCIDNDNECVTFIKYNKKNSLIRRHMCGGAHARNSVKLK